MTKINVLEPSVYNLISAGEVAVNPAGVVKELVENSLDAGATKILITVMRGGIDKIIVSDNGVGIAKSQVKLAFLPHATSKISTADDIYSIKTLGFRGEALASICNVSKLSILTRVENEEVGTYIEYDAGNVINEEERACNVGTEIVVSNLFYNTPARLKFLSPVNIEQREVNKIVETLMLSNPNVEFIYNVDSFTKIHTTGRGLEQTIVEIEGVEFLDKSFKVDINDGKYHLKGYCVLPSFEHSSKFARCFINGRITLNQCMASAVQAAYVNYTMKGISPTYILFFELPYDEVDVNITPQKTDVKFQNNAEVYGWITENVKNALLNYSAMEKQKRAEEMLSHAVEEMYNRENEEKENAPIKKNLCDYDIATSVMQEISGKQVTTEEFMHLWKKNSEIKEK